MLSLAKSKFTYFLDGEGRAYHPLPPEYREKVVDALKEDLGLLEYYFTFYFHEQWHPIDEQCQEILGANHPQPCYDGDAHEYYEGPRQTPRHAVRVFINPQNVYPLHWRTRGIGTGQGYLTHVHTFESPEELFVYLAAHEIRHIWQFTHRSSARKIRGLLRCNDEMDADLYASRMLSRCRYESQLPQKGKKYF